MMKTVVKWLAGNILRGGKGKGNILAENTAGFFGKKYPAEKVFAVNACFE